MKTPSDEYAIVPESDRRIEYENTTCVGDDDASICARMTSVDGERLGHVRYRGTSDGIEIVSLSALRGEMSYYVTLVDFVMEHLRYKRHSCIYAALGEGEYNGRTTLRAMGFEHVYWHHMQRGVMEWRINT